MDHEELDENTISAALAAGDLAATATLALERYGAPILGFLLARAENADDAHEIFSQFCEDLWVGLPSFKGSAPLRIWAYRIASNALAMYYRGASRQRRRTVPLVLAAEIDRIAAGARSETRTYERTDTKAWVQAIRAELHSEDRELLTLHVDHRLSFRECAQILLQGSQEVDDAELRRHEAALRKRYQRVREKIRALAIERGLIRSEVGADE